MEVFRRAAAIARAEWKREGQLVIGPSSRPKLERLTRNLTTIADMLLVRDQLSAEAAALYNEALPFTYKLRGLEHTDVARIYDRIAAALCLQLEQLSPGLPGHTNVGYLEPGLHFQNPEHLPPICAQLNRKIEYACLKSLRIRENHHRHLEAQRATRGGLYFNDGYDASASAGGLLSESLEVGFSVVSIAC